MRIVKQLLAFSTAGAVVLLLVGCLSTRALDLWQEEFDARAVRLHAGEAPDRADKHHEISLNEEAVRLDERRQPLPVYDLYSQSLLEKPYMTTGILLGRHRVGEREWDIFLVGTAQVMPYYPITPEFNELVDLRVAARTVGEGTNAQWRRSDYSFTAMDLYLKRGRFLMGSLRTLADRDRWAMKVTDSGVTIREQVSGAVFRLELSTVQK
jgi:hypothetical protein